MCTMSEEELGVMAYILTQYNLKPGLRKFGMQGEKAALKESHVEGDDAAPHHGYVDPYGCRQAVAGAKDESTIFAALLQGKANGRYQGEGMH